MTNEERLARASRAAALLNNELLTEAFAALERDYTAAWLNTKARDTDARERLWQAMQVTGKVKSHLKTVISDGKLAQREVDDLAASEKRRLFGVV